MKKLIELGASIDAAICAADEYDGGYNFERDRKIRDALMALPTVDTVQVVRCAVCRHFQCNMRGDGTLPNGVDEFECRNGRGGYDPMGFCDEGERKDGDNHG